MIWNSYIRIYLSIFFNFFKMISREIYFFETTDHQNRMYLIIYLDFTKLRYRFHQLTDMRVDHLSVVFFFHFHSKNLKMTFRDPSIYHEYSMTRHHIDMIFKSSAIIINDALKNYLILHHVNASTDLHFKINWNLFLLLIIIKASCDSNSYQKYHIIWKCHINYSVSMLYWYREWRINPFLWRTIFCMMIDDSTHHKLISSRDYRSIMDRSFFFHDRNFYQKISWFVRKVEDDYEYHDMNIIYDY